MVLNAPLKTACQTANQNADPHLEEAGQFLVMLTVQMRRQLQAADFKVGSKICEHRGGHLRAHQAAWRVQRLAPTDDVDGIGSMQHLQSCAAGFQDGLQPVDEMASS